MELGKKVEVITEFGSTNAQIVNIERRPSGDEIITLSDGYKYSKLAGYQACFNPSKLFALYERKIKV